MYGLQDRIRAAQRRKAIRADFARADGRRVLAKQLAVATDGGILAHRDIEQAEGIIAFTQTMLDKAGA